MVRFAGNRHARRYNFWLDVPASAPPLQVKLYVKRVQESDAAAEALLRQLPEWVSPAVSVLCRCVIAAWLAGMASLPVVTATGVCTWPLRRLTFTQVSDPGWFNRLFALGCYAAHLQAVVSYQSRWQF